MVLWQVPPSPQMPVTFWHSLSSMKQSVGKYIANLTDCSSAAVIRPRVTVRAWNMTPCNFPSSHARGSFMLYVYVRHTVMWNVLTVYCNCTVRLKPADISLQEVTSQIAELKETCGQSKSAQISINTAQHNEAKRVLEREALNVWTAPYWRLKEHMNKYTLNLSIIL